MKETLEAIAALEAVGGSVRLQGDELRVKYPEDKRDFVGPILEYLKAQRDEVKRLVQECLSGTQAPRKCPPLPRGVRLVRYSPKSPPVAVDVCSIVTNVERFIMSHLWELDARLHNPVQIRAGGSVFEILAKLREVGVELEIDSVPPSVSR